MRVSMGERLRTIAVDIWYDAVENVRRRRKVIRGPFKVKGSISKKRSEF